MQNPALMRTLCGRMSGNRLAEGHYCIPKWFSAAQIDKHIRYRLDAEFIKSRHQDIPNHVRGLGKEASQTDRADWQDQQEPYRILSFLSDKALNIIPLFIFNLVAHANPSTIASK